MLSTIDENDLEEFLKEKKEPEPEPVIIEEPVKELRKKLLFEQKVFTGASGTNVIRLLPPLVITKADADEFIARLKRVL